MGLFDNVNQNKPTHSQKQYSNVNFQSEAHQYQESAYQSHSRSDSEVSSFLKQTYQLFAGSLLSGTVGAYVGLGMVNTIASWFWGFIVLEIALLIGVYVLKRKPVINFAMLFGFTFVSGLTLAPLLTKMLGLAGGAGIVANAFLLTTLIFGALSIYAMTTKTNYMNMGKGLMIALIIVIIASIVNMFLGSPIFQIIISSISAMIFSAFILYDTQNIIAGNYETPIEGAIALYLDFLNLFIALLQILGIVSSDD